jgi:hypothetical protein
MKRRIKENDFVFFIIQRGDETLYFRIPGNDLNSKIYSLSFGYPIFYGPDHFDLLYTYHSYFESLNDFITNQNRFKTRNDLANQNDCEMENDSQNRNDFEILNDFNEEQKTKLKSLGEPIFSKYRIEGPFYFDKNCKAHYIILSKSIYDE